MFTFWTGLIVGVVLGSGLCIGALLVALTRLAAKWDADMAGD